MERNRVYWWIDWGSLVLGREMTIASGARMPGRSVNTDRFLFAVVRLPLLAFSIHLFFFVRVNGQSLEQLQRLKEIANESAISFVQKKQEAIVKAYEQKIPVVKQLPGGGIMELEYFEGDQPVYVGTCTNGAAATVSSIQLRPDAGAGYSLTGKGEILGLWEIGKLLVDHPGINGRAFVMDETDPITVFSDHALHVAGIMASNIAYDASGLLTSRVRGMAYEAVIDDYDQNLDAAEMAEAAANGLYVSNHSYGTICGWNGGNWYGNDKISPVEDYKFGFYNNLAHSWDRIAYNAPYYLIVKSAGNDRNDSGDGSHPKDGGADGFDCMPPRSVAKNILTIGAVSKNTSGYTGASSVKMSSFSSWGPTDDGRIKPDLVAPGVSIQSLKIGSTDYRTMSGTSQATPVVTGSIGLLLQHEKELYGQEVYRSSTMKALLIHTADEAGPANGPDYMYGWGQANFLKAAQLMDKDAGSCIYIREYTLNEGQVLRIPLVSVRGENQKVTICWTDPPGTPVAAALDPPDHMLVNDLDLRLKLSGKNYQETFRPWVLDKDNPSVAATPGDNTVDNVEQVDLQTSGADGYFSKKYIAEISHKGTLTGGSQVVSVIVSGFAPTGNSTFIGTVPKDVYGGLSRKDKTYCATKITSNAKIAIGRDVDFMSPGPITLKPGFKVEQGAYFSAMVSDELSCNSPGTFTLKSARIGGGTQQTPSGLVYERNVLAKALPNPGPEITITPGSSSDQFHLYFGGNPPWFLSAIKVSTGMVVYTSKDITDPMDIDLSASGAGEYQLMLFYEKKMVARMLTI